MLLICKASNRKSIENEECANSSIVGYVMGYPIPRKKNDVESRDPHPRILVHIPGFIEIPENRKKYQLFRKKI